MLVCGENSPIVVKKITLLLPMKVSPIMVCPKKIPPIAFSTITISTMY